MRCNRLLGCALTTLLPLFLAALPTTPIEQVQEIIIQNRILITINEKDISVLDVMKQMDVFLSQHYPQYLHSKTARYQYYSSQWRPTLQQMIDNELMVIDAESRDIKVNDSEVREEIQHRFGPNVMENLDKLDLSYEKAKKIVYQDMIVQRIQWLRVTSKVFQKVTSKEIKEAYNQYLLENSEQGVWKYQFLTIRANCLEKSREIGCKIIALKEEAQGNLSTAVDLIKNQLEIESQTSKENLDNDSSTSITVSKEFQLEEKEISQPHKDILLELKKGSWSEPIAQFSRDGTTLVRIFCLNDHIKKKKLPFEVLANDLRQKLLNDCFNQENQNYLKKLQNRLGFDEKSINIPAYFEPFSKR